MLLFQCPSDPLIAVPCLSQLQLIDFEIPIKNLPLTNWQLTNQPTDKHKDIGSKLCVYVCVCVSLLCVCVSVCKCVCAHLWHFCENMGEGPVITY